MKKKEIKKEIKKLINENRTKLEIELTFLYQFPTGYNKIKKIGWDCSFIEKAYKLLHKGVRFWKSY